MKYVVAALALLLAYSSSPAMADDDLPASTQVRGKILMVDCSGLLVQAAARDLKDHCVVIYSGVWTGDAKDGALYANDVEGNIGFARESTGAMNYIGKHAIIDINLNNGRIRSIQTPD